MRRCPECGSERIHLSRTKGRWEFLRRHLTKKRIHRCHTCEWRGWGPDHGPKYQSDDVVLASELLASEPPNLESVTIGPADPTQDDRFPSSLDK
jgi:hypothetical protein